MSVNFLLSQGFRYRLLPVHQGGQTNSEKLSSTKTAGNQAQGWFNGFCLCQKLQTVLRRHTWNSKSWTLNSNRHPRLKSQSWASYSPHRPYTRRGSLLSGQTSTPWSHPSWSQCCWWWASPSGWPKGFEAISINNISKSPDLSDRRKSRGYPYTQNHVERQGTPCSLLLPEEPPTQLASEGLSQKGQE